MGIFCNIPLQIQNVKNNLNIINIWHYEILKKNKIDLIITDHHLAGPVLPKAFEEIQKLLGGHSMEREFLIENLHIIQDRHNQLPASLLAALAQKMSLSQAEVYEVASFYHHFKVIKEEDQPLPKLTVRICDGIACEMSGATNLFRELSKQENADFNVVHAPCVGACNSAPVAVVGQRQIPLSNAKKVKRAITMGEITPVMPTYENLNTYRSLGGYEKLIECKANLLSREHVLEQLEKSGLRGMGGAGGGMPSTFSSTHLPRRTGDVRVA